MIRIGRWFVKVWRGTSGIWAFGIGFPEKSLIPLAMIGPYFLAIGYMPKGGPVRNEP